MKPSLHKLISDKIYYNLANRGRPIYYTEVEELAEQIVKLIRDYHLTE